jgi:hypothetical protein
MPEQSGSQEPTPRAPVWKRRRTWLFAGGGLLAVFVLLVIIGLIIGPQPSKKAAAAVSTTTTVAPPATTVTTVTPSTVITTTTTTPPPPTPPPTATSNAVAPLTSSPAAPPPVIAAGEPNHALTPGNAFATATTAQICVSGYSATVRNVTDDTRKAVFTSYAIAYPPPSGAYELDHLIPLELGGDNTAANLWPQVYHGAGSADVKDHLENHLHDLVCAGQLDLPTAQQAIAGDWMAAAAQYNPIGVTARVTSPPAAPANPAGPPPARPTAAPGAYYANCAAARAAGVAPLHRGDPGYSSKLDGDGDGIACEK